MIYKYVFPVIQVAFRAVRYRACSVLRGYAGFWSDKLW